MKTPVTTYRAPTSFPIFAAVCGSTRPAAPRFCSSSSFCSSSRSTTRTAAPAARSEIINPAIPFWSASKLSLSCPYEPPLSNGNTAIAGRVSCPWAWPPSPPTVGHTRTAVQSETIERESIACSSNSEGQGHPFLGRQHFRRHATHLGGPAGGGEQPVDVGIPVLRLVVEQHEASHPGVRRECDRLLESGMAPTAVLFELLRRVHRGLDQELRVREECDEVVAPRRRSVVMPPRAQLVVGDVRHTRSPRGRRQAIPQRRAGVPQPHGAHTERAQGELPTSRLDLSYGELRRQGIERDGEHGRVHLLAQDRLEGRGKSEEHTSELQSQSNLVCRLLLEKKKTNSTIHTSQASDIKILPLRRTHFSTAMISPRSLASLPLGEIQVYATRMSPS